MAFYWPLIFITFLGYGLSMWAIVSFQAYLPLTLACLSFSFFTVQQAGLMHDGGHRAIFCSKRANEIIGFVSGASIGMVLLNWKKRHNAHHARPNQEEMDPDLEVPFIAMTRELLQSKDSLQRRLGRWQAFYYYPLGSLVGFSNRLGSLSFFLRNPSVANFWRFCVYLPAMVAFFVAPFVIFPLDKAIFVFLVVHVSTGIYLANCFAPNHKGMQVVARDSELSFIEQQVSTSRNVSGGLVTDVLLVGLNHQVEHHLFPTCPRNKLGLLKPYVVQACDELGIEYVEESFVETNRSILGKLNAASSG